MTDEFDVFICYSTQHPIYADLIQQRVEANGFSSFRDVRGIVASLDWELTIDDAIAKSTVLVAVITKEALAAPQVYREIQLALSLKKPCIPLVMEKVEDLNTSLSKLGLNRLQAVYFVTLGLADGLVQFDQAIKTRLDDWAPIERNIQRLSHFSPIVRRQAVQELGETVDIRIIDALSEAFFVEIERQVKREIARQVEQFDDERTINILLRCWIDPEVSSYNGQEPIEIIRKLINRSKANEVKLVSAVESITDEREKIGAAFLFSNLGQSFCGDVGLNTLAEIVKSPLKNDVRIEAVERFSRTRHPNAKHELLNLKETVQDDEVVKFINEILYRIDRKLCIKNLPLRFEPEHVLKPQNE